MKFVLLLLITFCVVNLTVAGNTFCYGSFQLLIKQLREIISIVILMNFNALFIPLSSAMEHVFL